MLTKLMLGAHQFKKKSYPPMQDLFQQLSNGQDPETLFITCADSRIDPSLITQTRPGDLFVIRNIGNIFPNFPVQTSETGAIEYALSTFNIKNIIICGHSQCGAMKGLLAPDAVAHLPAVTSWLRHSQSVLGRMHEERTEQIAEPPIKLAIATKNNIVLQMDHLKTHPLIAKKLTRNELTIEGWYYEFESGNVSVYDPKSSEFISLENALHLVDAKPIDKSKKGCNSPISTNLSMMILTGFITILGIATIAIAFAVLNAATLGTVGLLTASLGATAALSGLGLFATSAYKQQQHVSDHCWASI